MKIPFFKYHGAGNDFVMIDNRSLQLPLFEPFVYQSWCNRKMGVGADGVILLDYHLNSDFKMLYINANGVEGSMCGNGGRCIVAFAQFLGIIDKETEFMAYDGLHKAKIEEKTVAPPIEGIGNLVNWVALEMGDVDQIAVDKDQSADYVLDTGSPHYVQFVESIEKVDVLGEGKKIRYNDHYKEKGVNVNFVEITENQTLNICTYERGVEAVTLACGTGATAAAMAYLKEKETPDGKYTIQLKTEGGPLEVSLTKKAADAYHNVWLKGPAVQVYSGELSIGE